MRISVVRVVGLSLALLTSGCALFDRGDEPAASPAPSPIVAAPERAIADDFLGALVQIEGYGPDSDMFSLGGRSHDEVSQPRRGAHAPPTAKLTLPSTTAQATPASSATAAGRPK